MGSNPGICQTLKKEARVGKRMKEKGPNGKEVIKRKAS